MTRGRPKQHRVHASAFDLWGTDPDSARFGPQECRLPSWMGSSRRDQVVWQTIWKRYSIRAPHSAVDVRHLGDPYPLSDSDSGRNRLISTKATSSESNESR